MLDRLPFKNVQEYIEILHNSAKVVILFLDQKANILYVNRYIENLTGYKRDDIIEKNWIKIFIPSLYNGKIENLFQDIIKNKNMHWGNENEILCKDGTTKILSWNNSLLLDENGNFEAVLSIGHDITALKATKLELENKITTLEQEKKKQKFLINALNNIIIETTGYEIIEANDKLLDFFGVSSLEEFQEEIRCVCYRFVEHPDYFHLGLVESGALWMEEINNLPKEKQVVIMADKYNELHAFAVKLTKISESNRFIISFEDITAMIEKSKEFEYKAYHDTLTKIYNRAKFNETLNITNQEGQNALLMLDIDKFKNINDTYGHDVGDKVLQKLSETIKYLIRPSDVFARWGGEEFALLLKDTNEKDAFEKAESLRQSIENINISGSPKFTVSFGGTMIKPLEPQSLFLIRTDEALYKSKMNGRNQTTFL